MFDSLFQMFSQSRQGQGALQQLVGQGFSQGQASGMLQAALPAAASAMHRQQGAQGQAGGHGLMDIGSSHYATNFLSGAVSSLLRGQGVMGAATDGLQGVIGGHVAEVVGQRFGLSSRVAGAAGAVMTPWLIDFLWEKMKGGSLDLGSLFGGQQQPGAAPSMGAGMGGMGAALGAGAAVAGGGGFLQQAQNMFLGGGGNAAPSTFNSGGNYYGGGLAPTQSQGWVVPGGAKGHQDSSTGKSIASVFKK